ncbi:MAG: aminotransferase class V-fold PLP-dependent enzyme [Thermomicrobiales bacterium]
MPSDDERAALLRDGAERAIRYLGGLDERPVGVASEAIARLALLDEALPDSPRVAAEVLAQLDTIGSAATSATAGGRFFGYVIGGSVPAALAANWLAAAWDQDAGMASVCPINARLEEIALGWLCELLRLPAGCGGAFVTGATMANFGALAAARHAVLARAGWDVEADGLFGAPCVSLLLGEEAHVSVVKALSLLGFGRKSIVRLPVDGQGRTKATGLPAITGPAIVCLQAGNVNTGACDPAPELIDWAREAGAWVHCDGAFGLWAAAAPAHAHLVEGFGEADSWAVDAHKWLNVPYDSGIALVRDTASLQAAMAAGAAPYLASSGWREPDQFTPEMSRRARGVDIWAALSSLGRSGVSDLIERSCRHAARMADALAAAGYEVLNEVVLNQVLVSFGSPDETRRVIVALQEDGTCWCGGTVWQGRTAMRISVSSWATKDADIERSIGAMLRIAGMARA